MKKLTDCTWNRAIMIILSILLFVLCGCVSTTPETEPESGETLGQDEEVGPKPGLSVVYIFQKYRNVDEVPTGEEALALGRRGEPVTILNHKSGKDEVVFASGRTKGIGMVMEGLLRFDEPGTYQWQALSNDGIRMFIQDEMILEDPGVHSDRLSPVGIFQVTKEGYYHVRIIYFQRKGTAALKLYWQPPWAKDFSLVPAETYWH